MFEFVGDGIDRDGPFRIFFSEMQGFLDVPLNGLESAKFVTLFDSSMNPVHIPFLAFWSVHLEFFCTYSNFIAVDILWDDGSFSR